VYTGGKGTVSKCVRARYIRRGRPKRGQNVQRKKGAPLQPVRSEDGVDTSRQLTEEGLEVRARMVRRSEVEKGRETDVSGGR